MIVVRIDRDVVSDVLSEMIYEFGNIQRSKLQCWFHPTVSDIVAYEIEDWLPK